MEKTMARALYKKMEIGKEYTSSELYDLVEDEYPIKMWQNHYDDRVDVRKIVAKEMWKIVNAGFATTTLKTEKLALVRGIRFGAEPTSYQTYTIRYWTKTK